MASLYCLSLTNRLVDVEADSPSYALVSFSVSVSFPFLMNLILLTLDNNQVSSWIPRCHPFQVYVPTNVNMNRASTRMFKNYQQYLIDN